MKQGNSVITLAMALLAAGLAAYLGYYAWNTFNTPYTTTVAYAYINDDSAQGEGLLVRSEQVLPAQSGIVELTRAEGERVAAGKTVALVYADGAAQTAQTRREELEREIAVLEDAAGQAGDLTSTARLDEEVIQSLVTLRAAVAQGSFSRLEEQAAQVKSAVLRRDLTYGDGLDTGTLSERLRLLKDELSQLEARSGASVARVKAPKAGVFSAQVDGCEELTPQQLLQADHSGLVQIIASASPQVGSEQTGKLIYGQRWYLAVSLSQQEGERLARRSSITVRFTGDFAQDVDMRVERVTTGEGGAAAVLSSDEYLADTTLLRRQNVELIFDTTQGIRLPRACLHMETEETVDESTGQTQTVSRLGVYALSNGRAVFKEVEVVSEGEDFYVLRSVTTGKKALRAGDRVIVRGTGLFDGKVMEA